MERLRDVTAISQALHRVLMHSDDDKTRLQDAQHKVHLLGATDKTLTGLVSQLNELFFHDIVPALKRARQATTAPSPQGAQDSLDRYLARGDAGDLMPQAFVDHMSGWAAPSISLPPKTKGVDSETETDTDMPADQLHDLLVANSRKLTATRALAVSTRCTSQQNVATKAQGVARPQAYDPITATAWSSETVYKQRNAVPPRMESSRLQSRCTASTLVPPSPRERHDTRHDEGRGTQSVPSLVADKVLSVRTKGSLREFLIRWKDQQEPWWIARRNAPSQAKELINQYVATAGQDKTSSRVKGQTPLGHLGEKRVHADHAALYRVDHIVTHRVFHKRRQYLVRWESYDQSDDTWEDASELAADVPDIVAAYEKHLCRGPRRRDKASSPSSESSCHSGTKVKTRGREISGSARACDTGTGHLLNGTTQGGGEHVCKKRRRLARNEMAQQDTASTDHRSEGRLEERSNEDALG